MQAASASARAHCASDGGGTLPGLGAATAAMVAWGFSGILVALTTQPALVVALERMLLGVPLIGAMLAVTRRRLTWQALRRSAPGGLLLCGDIAMFYSAVKLTSIADATIIGALQPALVLFLARPLFGERVRLTQVLWTMVAIAGVGAVVAGAGPTGSDAALGDALAAGSTCCWTGYWLISKRIRAPRVVPGASGPPTTDAVLGPVEYTAAVMLVATIAMVPVALLSGERLSWGSPEDWFWMGLMALIPGGAHVLLNWAHRFVGVSVSSVIVSVNPVVAAGGAALFLGQPLDAVEVIGGVAAIIAVSMVARGAARDEPALAAAT
jgi:drug/metabolite transporter (DMT)-like permease